MFNVVLPVGGEMEIQTWICWDSTSVPSVSMDKWFSWRLELTFYSHEELGP